MKTWTVVRFPNGSWSYGGRSDSPDYSECEVWEIEAETAEKAVKKARGRRARAQKIKQSIQPQRRT
jgi:hypothetical protein